MLAYVTAHVVYFRSFFRSYEFTSAIITASVNSGTYSFHLVVSILTDNTIYVRYHHCVRELRSVTSRLVSLARRSLSLSRRRSSRSRSPLFVVTTHITITHYPPHSRCDILPFRRIRHPPPPSSTMTSPRVSRDQRKSRTHRTQPNRETRNSPRRRSRRQRVREQRL